MNPNILVKNIVTQPVISDSLAVMSRLLMSYIFIIAGWAKIGGYTGTAVYMASKGLPSFVLILVILLELGGGLAILIGFQTRFTAFFFAVFCIASGLIFHGAPEETTSLMKNFALAGGFIYILIHGAGRFSIDALIEKQ